MAPEQARGEVDRLDERCDVFALGSILCEILTGLPAFDGRSSGEIQRKAARGDLADAFARLDSSGSDPDLVALAKSCLAPEPDDRPRHAGEVAARIGGYRTGVQERLRLAEIARAEQQARAEEATKRARVERDRLRLTVALAASIFGLIVLGGGGWAYLAHQRAARRAATDRVVNAALDEATLRRGQARAATIGDLSNWPRALASAKEARSHLVAGDPTPALRDRVNELLVLLEREQADATRRAAEADRDHKFLDRLEMIEFDTHQDDHGSAWADTAYLAAFREFGVDVDKIEPVEAGRFLANRSVPLELAYYLHDWALQYNYIEHLHPKQIRIISVANATDPDPCAVNYGSNSLHQVLKPFVKWRRTRQFCRSNPSLVCCYWPRY